MEKRVSFRSRAPSRRDVLKLGLAGAVATELSMLYQLVQLPVRLAMGDRPSWCFAGAIIAAIVTPDLYRLTLGMVTGFGNVFKVTPVQPATYIVLPK